MPRLACNVPVNRFNEHEIEQARTLAKPCGAALWLDKHFWFPDEGRSECSRNPCKNKTGDRPVASVFMPGNTDIHTERRQLWGVPMINANGDMHPCCLACRKDFRVGNLFEQSIEEIGRGERMQLLRLFVVGIHALSEIQERRHTMPQALLQARRFSPRLTAPRPACAVRNEPDAGRRGYCRCMVDGG